MLQKTNRGTIPGSGNSGNNLRSRQDCRSGRINARVHSECRRDCHGSRFLWRDIHSSGLVGSGFHWNIGQCLIRGGICFGVHHGGLDRSRFVHRGGLDWKVKTAMGIGHVVRFVDINLFNGRFHLEIFVEDDGGKGERVTDVGSWFACKRGLSYRYSIHPIHEACSRVAIGAVPHTVVKGGMRGRIEILSVAN
uniref:Uncharacterized protein n=1 Tax=Romanomermis culicivorax TaxID=13658 RepID=A0A915HJ04_ROMCU